MTALFLALLNIRHRFLASALCIVSFAAGIAVLSALLIISDISDRGMLLNAKGIDLVIGAKGSPIQLVLSSVYHSDVPTGNIDNKDVREIMAHPQISKTIPLALGDNYRGYRIVGTTPDYVGLYDASITEGQMFQQPFDAVAGASTGLKIGQEFAGAHGFSADSDDIHDFHLYKVTGILAPTGRIIDRLILTSVHSVQELHLHPHEDDADAEEEKRIAHQVTALLVKVRSPVAVLNLPVEINRSEHMQAARPAYEMARLSQNLGMGRDAMMALAFMMVGISALMLFASLAAGLSSRCYDLAMMRVMGASPVTLLMTIVAESLTIGTIGWVCGVGIGHVASYVLSQYIPVISGMMYVNEVLAWHPSDGILALVTLAATLLACIVPAYTLMRMDISDVLARGRR